MLKAELVGANFYEAHQDTRIEYTTQLLSLNEETFDSVILSKEGKKCFCSNKLRNSQIYIMPSCCFRAFHVDCYIRYIWSQFRLNKKKRRFCIDCKEPKEDLIIGALDPETLSLKDVYKVENDDYKFTNLLDRLEKMAKFDVEHRLVTINNQMTLAIIFWCN